MKPDAETYVETTFELSPGALPSDWQVASLGQICIPSRETVNPTGYPAEPFEYYSIPAFQQTRKPAIAYGREILSQKLLVEDGAVLFGRLNPRVPKVWRVRSMSHYRKIASTEFLALLPGSDLDGDFLTFLCWSTYVMGVSKGLVGGSTPSRQRVDHAAFYEIKVPVPPLAEQRAIAGVLAKFQAAVEVQERIVATLKELKAATMAKLFREGIVRGFMFDSHIFDKILDGRIDPSHFRPGIRLFVTHVQRDEIERCRDANRRQGLLEVFDAVGQEVVPTESGGWDVSKWGGAKWGGSSTLEQLRMGNPKHTEDALIAETCVRRNVVLVTEEPDFRKRVHRAGGEAISFADFLAGRWRRLKQSEIGEIPESWELVRLGDVASIERGKFAHRPRNDPRFYGGTIPFIQTGDVAKSDGRIRTHTQTLNDRGLAISRVFPKGTIVLTIAANIADTGILEFASAFPDSLVGIMPDSTMDTEFLELYLRTQKVEMNRLAPKGTQKNINIQFLKPWPTPRPSIGEQREIARMLHTLDERVRQAGHRLDRFRLIFVCMLHLLMTGQIRVSVEGEGVREATARRDVAPEEIEQFVAELVRRFEPERVVLFGSLAPGSPQLRAEVGLLVVMPFEGRSLAQAVRIEREIEHDLPLEVVARRPEEVEDAVEKGNPLIEGILKRGRTLYVGPGESPARRREREAPKEPRPSRKGTVSEDTLRELVQRIVEAVQPEQIILFGSAARGEMGPDSDVDLMVVKSCVDRREIGRTIRRQLWGVAPGLPKDIVVVTPGDVERDRDTIGYIIRPALREGRVIYAA